MNYCSVTTLCCAYLFLGRCTISDRYIRVVMYLCYITVIHGYFHGDQIPHIHLEVFQILFTGQYSQSELCELSINRSQ